jgi:hypothetical protein
MNGVCSNAKPNSKRKSGKGSAKRSGRNGNDGSGSNKPASTRLLKSAAAFQQAGAIRKYVEAIRATQTDNAACSKEELERWSQWALAEAERIDPAVGGRFLLTTQEGYERNASASGPNLGAQLVHSWCTITCKLGLLMQMTAL